jgi:hypothetical protein
LKAGCGAHCVAALSLAVFVENGGKRIIRILKTNQEIRISETARVASHPIISCGVVAIFPIASFFAKKFRYGILRS